MKGYLSKGIKEIIKNISKATKWYLKYGEKLGQLSKEKNNPDFILLAGVGGFMENISYTLAAYAVTRNTDIATLVEITTLFLIPLPLYRLAQATEMSKTKSESTYKKRCERFSLVSRFYFTLLALNLVNVDGRVNLCSGKTRLTSRH